MRSVADHIARERRLVGAKQLRYSLDFARHYHRWYNAVLLGVLPAEAGALTVLDCGCGTGILLSELQPRYARTIGLDLCEDNLRVAREHGSGAGLVAGNVEDLPLAPASVHHVVCRGVLYRLDDVDRGFQQLFAGMAPGGHLVIAEPIGDSRAIGYFRAAALATGTHPFQERRVEYLTTRAWIAAAERAGFRTERWFHFGYVAFPLLGFPEAFPLMRRVPGRMGFARILLLLDRLLARTPGIRSRSWQAIFHFRKPLDAS